MLQALLSFNTDETSRVMRPNGTMRCTATLFAVGDHSVRRSALGLPGDPQERVVLRIPESMASDEYLANLESLPLVMGHTPGAVDVDNIRDHRIGSVGKPWRDGAAVRAHLYYEGRQAIKKLRNGELNGISAQFGYVNKHSDTGSLIEPASPPIIDAFAACERGAVGPARVDLSDDDEVDARAVLDFMQFMYNHSVAALRGGVPNG